jgi:DNA-binding GntR family transcriptional regulator
VERWEANLANARVSAADRENAGPLHSLVAGRIQDLIESGGIPVGARLENEIQLAERLGVSRPTMRQAMKSLTDQGLIVRKPGFGTEVIRPKVRRPVELTSLYDDLTKSGRRPRTEVLSLQVTGASDTMAHALNIAPRSEVTEVRRLRYTEAEPLALMFNVIPVHVLRLTESDLAAHGLYELLRGAGQIPRTATQVIGARVASGQEARMLGDKRGAAVLTMTRTAWDTRGHGIEFGSHIYRAERYAFELALDS